MNTNEILKDIGKRTNGDIYLGVVGPVRVGKSTFIKRFMELIVIPKIADIDVKKRTIDELPQSGEGKMIMTVEPKFVPNNAVTLELDEEFQVNIRLVDCVGYVVEGAKGFKDESGIRYVKTPWFLEAIPFDEAAKVGTKKVIQDHSTIGIVLTTDGSITDIGRENYEGVEDEVIEELMAIGKPFIIVVNTTDTNSTSCITVTEELRAKYNVPVLPLKVNEMTHDDVYQVLKGALYEFPISEVKIEVPKWIASLDNEHWLKKEIDETIQNSIKSIEKLKDVEDLAGKMEENEYITKVSLKGVDTANGSAQVCVNVDSILYNQVLKEIIGEEVKDKADLLKLLTDLSKAKKEYDHVASAIKMVKQTGYGYAVPNLHEVEVEDPIVIKQGPRYGMKITAKASTIHMMKVDVESNFEPIIGSKDQAEAFINYLLSNNKDNPGAIFECDIFGRKLGDLISEGINVKLLGIPETTRIKIHDILSKIVNKGKGNLIAIVL